MAVPPAADYVAALLLDMPQGPAGAQAPDSLVDQIRTAANNAAVQGRQFSSKDWSPVLLVSVALIACLTTCFYTGVVCCHAQ